MFFNYNYNKHFIFNIFIIIIMPKIFESEYKQLRQLVLLLIGMIEDEECKIRWYEKLNQLDKNIDRKREIANSNRRFNCKRYKRMEVKVYENHLDFS